MVDVADAPTIPSQTADAPWPDVAIFRRFLDDFRNVMQEPRRLQQRDRDYYDGKQLTPRERAALRGRKQPELIKNRVKPAVNGTIGVAERGKTDPRAYPRTPQDEEAADVATDILRYVSDANRFGQAKLYVLKDQLVPGEGAAVVEVGEDQEVIINQIPQEEFFYDPRSRRVDFRDARYLGIAKWMAADALEAVYPDKSDIIRGSLKTGAMNTSGDSLFGDKPNNALPWVDQKNSRLLVGEVYYLEGSEWMRAVFCGADALEYGPSPYVDKKGRTMCAIEALSGYVDSENRRYGMVRDMISPQDEVNRRASAALHLVNSRQVQQADLNAPPVDSDIARQEAARPDGVIPPGWQIVPHNDRVQENLALMQEAKQEIERAAPIPSLVGRADSSASGRAQLVQTQAGMTELALLFSGFTDWERRVYDQVWARVQQYWTDEKLIRVTDDEGAPKFLTVNEVVEPAIYVPGPDGQPMAGPDGKPVVLRPAVTKNRPSEMDMDIIVDSVPDTANVQQEQFQELMSLLQSNPAYAQAVPFDVAVDMSSLTKKREFKKRLQEHAEKAAVQQQQVAEDAARKVAAEIHKSEASATKSEADARATNLDTSIATFEAAARLEGVMPPPGGPQGPAGAPQGEPGMTADQVNGPPL